MFWPFDTAKKLKSIGILGMNARNYKFIARLNKRRLYPLVDDKQKLLPLKTASTPRNK